MLSKIIYRSWKRRVRLRGMDGERPNIHKLGEHGEQLAARWLRWKGIKVLYRNFSGPKGGELDIVARDGDLLLFIEVKTRYEPKIGRPLDAVNLEKRKYMKRAGLAWMSMLDRDDVSARYDVIEVILREGQQPFINQVENISIEKNHGKLTKMLPQELEETR